MHLSREERHQLISFTREALDGHGFHHVAVMAGTGTDSLQETRTLCIEAANAGAQWAMVLPPSYWVIAMTKQALIDYYNEVSR